eukprot:1688198-Prymnesium_polylepis.1
MRAQTPPRSPFAPLRTSRPRTDAPGRCIRCLRAAPSGPNVAVTSYISVERAERPVRAETDRQQHQKRKSARFFTKKEK